MPDVGSKYHVFINGQGYVLSHNRSGQHYYQKKRAPAFVNKFGSGDASYRDATFWQYWASTNWRNGAKQLRADDPGKYWKSENINVTQLDEISLSRALTSIGQIGAGLEVNCLEAWRSSQSWWNSNYGYRQQITVTAPATQLPVGYPVRITVDTAALQSASKLLANRNDWRVVYFNGSSNVEIKRDYISTTLTVFSLQAAIAANASDANYYIYYGYSGESTNSQPTTDSEWNEVYGMYGGAGGVSIDANTLAVWHGKEGTGSTVADTDSTNDLGWSDSSSWNTTGPFGRSFVTGSGGGSTEDTAPGVSVSAAAELDVGSFTVEFWRKSTQGNFTLVNYGKDSDSSVKFKIQYQDGTKVYFEKRTGAATNQSVVTNANYLVHDGSWHHYAITFDGTSTANFYRDGTLFQTLTFSGTAGIRSVAGRIHFSRDSGGTDNFAHIRMSNVVRGSFPYAITGTVSITMGSEITTQPPAASFDLYAGGSDGGIYKWDGDSAFTEMFNVHRLTWYETGNDTDMKIGDDGGTEKAQAQKFQVTTTAKIKSIEAYLKKLTGTPGDITVRIETDNAGVPSGTLADSNATATITAFSTATYAWVRATFATSFSLTGGTSYWLVLKTAAAANDNNYAWAADGSSPTYANGNNAASADGGSTWSADTAKDMYFRIRSEATQVNDFLVSNVGGTRKMLIACGEITDQQNGNARIFSFEGTNFALEKTFTTTTESQVTKLAEFNGKLYAGVGPQAKVYEGTAPGTWTLSKDIDVPQNPGYIFCMKEYNGRLYVGGGSPEFLSDKHYNGFWFVFDSTVWASLYPFDFTELRSFEFYDAFLFGTTYHGQIYVYDTATLNPLFNFKDLYGFNVSVLDSILFDDKIYFMLYPQQLSGETNVGIWVFDRHGLSLAHKISGPTGYRCAAVVNNILVIGTGSDGQVYKLDQNVYAASGNIQTSYFDANLPSITKLYNAVVLQHDPLPAGGSVAVYYKFKESDSWTLLGTSNTEAAESKTLSFPAATTSKRITFKCEFATSNTATSPKVKELVLQYTLYPERKWQWSMRLLAKKSLQLLDRTTESLTAAQIRSAIETAQNSGSLITFQDRDNTTYNVLFNDIDESNGVVNQSDISEDEVAINLLEA